MPTTQEIHAGFQDFIELVAQVKKKDTFVETCNAFSIAFQSVVSARKWPQPQSDEQDFPSTFFSPFLAESPFWRSSIEIFEAMDHYTVFDRHGNFAIYLKHRDNYFGTRVVTNDTTHAIASLEDQSARNFLSNFATLRDLVVEKNEELRELRIQRDNLQAQIDAGGARSGRHQWPILNSIIALFRHRRR